MTSQDGDPPSTTKSNKCVNLLAHIQPTEDIDLPVSTEPINVPPDLVVIINVKIVSTITT